MRIIQYSEFARAVCKQGDHVNDLLVMFQLKMKFLFFRRWKTIHANVYHLEKGLDERRKQGKFIRVDTNTGHWGLGGPGYPMAGFYVDAENFNLHSTVDQWWKEFHEKRARANELNGILQSHIDNLIHP